MTTPLHDAAYRGKVAVAKVLLGAKADIDRPSKVGAQSSPEIERYMQAVVHTSSFAIRPLSLVVATARHDSIDDGGVPRSIGHAAVPPQGGRRPHDAGR